MTRKFVFLGLMLIVVLGLIVFFADSSLSSRNETADSARAVLNQEEQAASYPIDLNRTDLREFFRDLAGSPEIRSTFDAEIENPKWDDAQRLLLRTLFHGPVHSPGGGTNGGEVWLTLGIDRDPEPDYGETWGP